MVRVLTVYGRVLVALGSRRSRHHRPWPWTTMALNVQGKPHEATSERHGPSHRLAYTVYGTLDTASTDVRLTTSPNSVPAHIGTYALPDLKGRATGIAACYALPASGVRSALERRWDFQC